MKTTHAPDSRKTAISRKGSEISDPVKAEPIIVRAGSVQVKIFTVKTRTGTVYSVDWYAAGKRCRKAFADLAEARREADMVADRLSAGDAAVLQLTSTDRAVYVAARAAVKPLDISLDLAAKEYFEARKVLGTCGSIIEAARFYVKHHSGKLPKKTVQEVFEELLAAKRAARKSELYLTDLRYRLGAFSRSFQCQLASVTAQDTRDFLANLELSPRSHNNFLRGIGTLFSFARSRGYLMDGHDPLKGIERQVETGEDISTLAPEDMVKLLANASAGLLPVLVLGGFCGLRTSEAARLHWENIHLDERFIEIRKGITKTRSRRTLPVLDNAMAWLRPYSGRKGLVWPHSVAFLFEAMADTAAKAKVEWRRNSLRHTFITARLSVLKSDAQVALEAGNSPQMVHANYKGLFSEKMAKAWFAISPARPANVVTLPMAETA